MLRMMLARMSWTDFPILSPNTMRFPSSLLDSFGNSLGIRGAVFPGLCNNDGHLFNWHLGEFIGRELGKNSSG
jgi:hypothetical protein